MVLTATSLSSWLTILGLIAVASGSFVTARAVIISNDEAIKVAGQIGAATYGIVVPTKEQFLQQPAVRNLIRQSQKARTGLLWIFAGTLIQIIAAAVPLLHSNLLGG